MSGVMELFRFDDATTIRVFLINGRGWAVAADICDALEIQNSRMAMGRVDATDKMVIRRSDTVSSTDGIWESFAPQVQQVGLVSEDGATDLILESRKPGARAFRRWLTHEVWPSIRDTGTYNTDPALTGEELFARAVLEAQTMIAAKDERIAALEQQAEIDRPAIEYVNTHVVVGDDVMLIEDWGRAYGLTKPQAFALLRDEKNLIYPKTFERWSRTKGCKVTETEYRPRAGKSSFTWFDVKEQRDAPRRNNGQARKTCYVKAVHAVDLARLVGLLPNLEAAS